MDIDVENPFEPTGKGNEDGDELIPMTSTTIGGGFDNHGMDETSFHSADGLIQKESLIDDAWERIRQKYPKVNPAAFTATIDEFDQVVVKLKRIGGKSHPFFNENGEINDKLSKKITDSLGPPAENIIETNEEKIKEMREEQRGALTSEQEEAIIREIEQMERENEIIEEKMSLSDRVKAVFKKNGFTAFSVITAVGIIIGVIPPVERVP
ncbi:hypothetical protein QZH41_006421 [Actinostola sp. cb2023]|nr:hypothetical protein QZH41_006421 [Actinostola sp. cb2023]